MYYHLSSAYRPNGLSTCLTDHREELRVDGLRFLATILSDEEETKYDGGLFNPRNPPSSLQNVPFLWALCEAIAPRWPVVILAPGHAHLVIRSDENDRKLAHAPQPVFNRRERRQAGRPPFQILHNNAGLLNIYPLEHIEDGQSLDVFFVDSEKKKSQPSLLFVEPPIVDGFRIDACNGPIPTEQIISGTGTEEIAANGVGEHCTVGNGINNTVLTRILRLVDSHSGVQGFLVFHSSSEGSGFFSLLTERLAVKDGQKSKLF